MVLPFKDAQIGKKFGEHRDTSRSGYRTADEYKQRAQDIFENPSAEKTIFPPDAVKYPSETHYKLGDDLLRLDPQGGFRSMYPI